MSHCRKAKKPAHSATVGTAGEEEGGSERGCQEGEKRKKEKLKGGTRLQGVYEQWQWCKAQACATASAEWFSALWKSNEGKDVIIASSLAPPIVVAHPSTPLVRRTKSLVHLAFGILGPCALNPVLLYVTVLSSVYVPQSLILYKAEAVDQGPDAT